MLSMTEAHPKTTEIGGIAKMRCESMDVPRGKADAPGKPALALTRLTGSHLLVSRASQLPDVPMDQWTHGPADPWTHVAHGSRRSRQARLLHPWRRTSYITSDVSVGREAGNKGLSDSNTPHSFKLIQQMPAGPQPDK